jgi:hypothetical protein
LSLLAGLVLYFPGSLGAQPMDFPKLPIVRRTPSSFKSLPRSIARHLESNGYTIPQIWTDKSLDPKEIPPNVIHGSFRRQGQVDWAVLCSRNDSSAIVIFWGGSTSNTARLRHSSDDDWLQSIDEERHQGYSRYIEVANPKRIREVGEGLPSGKIHDGVEEFFEGKASSVFYFDKSGSHEFHGDD